jgi:hypothetical protein
MVDKELLRNFALTVKQKTGKFPLQVDWVTSKGYPCSRQHINTLFNNSYNNFRDFCGEPHLLRTQEIILEWIKFNCIIDNNECWNWSKTISNDGYGIVSNNDIHFRTHRLVYELYYSSIPINLLIRHKCDNRKCCNPQHLELGTHSDNAKDIASRNSPTLIKHNNIELFKASIQYKTLEEKIKFYLSEVSITDSDCFVPTLLTAKPAGYYQIKFKSHNYLLHRLVLSNKLNKEYKEINIARHTCHNKSCINPNHLIEGTPSNNVLDSRNYSKSTKLTEQEVRDIRLALLNTTFPKRGDKKKFDEFWANKLNVARTTIVDIRLYKKWKDITVN